MKFIDDRTAKPELAGRFTRKPAGGQLRTRAGVAPVGDVTGYRRKQAVATRTIACRQTRSFGRFLGLYRDPHCLTPSHQRRTEIKGREIISEKLASSRGRTRPHGCLYAMPPDIRWRPRCRRSLCLRLDKRSSPSGLRWLPYPYSRWGLEDGTQSKEKENLTSPFTASVVRASRSILQASCALGRGQCQAVFVRGSEVEHGGGEEVNHEVAVKEVLQAGDGLQRRSGARIGKRD
ncbi:hypothetical protein LXA43DRAFT_1046056, partial [Ganoderma leucocontextum]